MAAKDTHLRRWGALYILLVFFFVSWGGQFANQLQVQKNEAVQHNQDFSMEEFWPQFWSSTFENWQSEWLQLFTQGLIIAGYAEYLFRKGQEEEYKTQQMIKDLKKEISRLKR